jgi:ubiquinone/menaquinone biosynthesis C-methylase UbiE
MEEATLQFIAAQLRKPEGDEGIQMGVRMNDGNKYINEHTIEALSATGNEDILEIGMGNGFFVHRILDHQPLVRYTGCDFSIEMVNDAKKRNYRFIKGGQASFFMATASDLPFEDNSFDKFFTVNTLYFWEDPVQTLADIRRVIRPAGKLYIAIRPKELMKAYPFVKYGFKMYDAPDLESLLTANGFSVQQTIVRDEPEQNLTGRDIKVETLIVVADVG